MFGHKFPFSKNVPWIGAYYTKQLKNILSGLHPIIGEKISIRVNGIDTPEIKGKCEKEKYDAQQARDMVTDILKDSEQITLMNMEKGKYFEVAADVIVDGKNLAGMLLDRFPAGLDFFSCWSDMGLYISSDLTTFWLQC